MYTYLMCIWMYPKWVGCCDICLGIYTKVPSLNVDDWTFISAYILLWGWAEMKFSAGTLTTKRVDRVVAYKECTYVCHRLYQNLLLGMERTYGTCMHHESFIPFSCTTQFL